MSQRMYVIGDDGQAKINLIGANGVPELVFSIGIKKPEMQRLFAGAVTRRNELLFEWERIHG